MVWSETDKLLKVLLKWANDLTKRSLSDHQKFALLGPNGHAKFTFYS